MNMNKEKIALADRWNHIDFIKCLGILFVIIYHSGTYSYNWIEAPEKFYYIRYYYYYLTTILSSCVPLFFFANGYLLLSKKFDLKRHIKRRISLVILTGIWGSIGLISIMFIEGQRFTVSEFISNLWNWRPIGWINHLWYMGALICIYVFFPLIKHVYDTKKTYFYYFTIIVFAFTFGSTFISYCGSIIVDLFFGKNIVRNVNVFNMFNPFRGIYGYSFVYFCVGGIMYDLKDKILAIKSRNVISGVCILISCGFLFGLGIIFSNISGSIWDVVWNGYDTIFTLINVIAIYVLSLSYKKNVALIRTISSNTLGIFFMHNIFIHITNKFIYEIPIVCTFVGNVIYAIGLILVCLLITLIIKKIPIIKQLVKV